MSKEYLEVKPEDISKLLYEVYDVPSGICKYIKGMVQRLESIDNANPSEALECVEDLIFNFSVDEYVDRYDNNLQVIKNALLKAQANARSEEILQKYYQEGITLDSVRALKQEKDNYKKVLEIVFKKNVDMLLIKKYDNVSDYNSAVWLSGRDKLTQEEFDLLKEALEK